MMRQKIGRLFAAFAFCLSLLAALVLALAASAQDDQGEVERVLPLSANGIPDGMLFGHSGQAGVIHISVEEGQTTLEFSLTGLTPNAVHSVWLGLDSGANPCGGTGQPACRAPFVSCNGPQCVALDPNGNKINVFGFSPAAADDAGFTAGMGLDPNGFVTDGDGDAEFKIKLNYDIFRPMVAPTVLRPGITQGLAVGFDGFPGTTCSTALFTGTQFPARIDSGYARVYNSATVANLPAVSPSYQLLDASGKPLLVRASVRAFQIIEHFDRITHGHVPGFHVANPMASSCGDFDNRLTGNLADAALDD